MRQGTGRRLGGALLVMVSFVLGASTVLAPPRPVGAATVPPAADAVPVGTVDVVRSGAGAFGSLASGSDGNVWFTTAGAVGFMTPAGAFTIFDDIAIVQPRHLVAGTDGTLWFLNGGSIMRVTTAGVLTSITDPAIVAPTDLAAGPGGTVWFTNGGVPGGPSETSIGRITPAGVVSTFDTAAVGHPVAITPGPDGNLWFAANHDIEMRDGRIAKITPEGVITSEGSTSAGYLPRDLVWGPDGHVWISGDHVVEGPNPFATAPFVGVFGTTGGGYAYPYEDPALANLPIDALDLVAGPDGNVWLVTGGRLVQITPAGVFTVSNPDQAVGVSAAARIGEDLWFAGRGPIASHGYLGRRTAAGDVTTFVERSIHEPNAITAGSDGNVWFTNGTMLPGSISRLTPAGELTTFAGPGIARPAGITSGPGGDLWFTDQEGGGWIGRLTQAGVVTVFDDPRITYPEGIVRGSDQNLWFLNQTSIGRITPTGDLTFFEPFLPTTFSAIAAGPDGDVWFVSSQGFGHLATSGAITFLRVPTPGPSGGYWTPTALTAGPDGNVWVVGHQEIEDFPEHHLDVGRIGRLTPAGVLTVFTGPDLDLPTAITAGFDGALWFTQHRVTAAPSGSIGRITPAGAITRFDAPDTSGQTITRAADGNMWFVDTARSAIDRVHTGVGALTPSRFIDVLPDAPFHADVTWLADEHITGGYPDGGFHPTAGVSRQAVAAFLYRRAGNPDGPAPVCATAPFPDVPVDAPFCGEIAWLVGQHLTEGYADGLFHPNATVSRQAMAAFLYRSAGAPVGAHPTCAEAAFADVLPSAPFCGEIAWLAEHGVVHGFDDGTFRPAAAVSRQAVAAFLHRLSSAVAPPSATTGRRLRAGP